jgi:hypothetical protein
VLSSGQLLRGELADGAFVEGQAAGCASCHRRSGFGGVEGTIYVPPVTGSILFSAAGADRNALFRPLFQENLSLASRAHLFSFPGRPAYTRESLAAALREGHDPAGRAFEAPLPRYRLDDGNLDHLLAYLRTLEAEPAPGVEENAIHVATVFTPGADPDQKRAILDVYEAWVRWKNIEIDRRRQRPDSVGVTDEDLRFADRRWVLHIWEPQGPPDTWTRQLAEQETQSPVFAVLGGLSGPDEPWAPVHAFCESREIPCLFPETELPVIEPAGATTFYFSGGVVQEAEALASHLREIKPDRIVQVYRNTAGKEAAAALERFLPRVETIPLARPSPGHEVPGLGAAPGQPGFKPHSWGAADSPATSLPGVLVLWLPERDLAALGDLGGFERIFLSASLLGETAPELPVSWRDRAFLLHRRAVPGRELPQSFRIRSWLRTRGVERRHEALQLDAWFTLSLADEAISRLAGHFSRELFIENVERETERMPDPGVWPHLVLSPGRRIASRGVIFLEDRHRAPGAAEPVLEK